MYFKGLLKEIVPGLAMEAKYMNDYSSSINMSFQVLTQITPAHQFVGVFLCHSLRFLSRFISYHSNGNADNIRYGIGKKHSLYRARYHTNRGFPCPLLSQLHSDSNIRYCYSSKVWSQPKGLAIMNAEYQLLSFKVPLGMVEPSVFLFRI